MMMVHDKPEDVRAHNRDLDDFRTRFDGTGHVQLNVILLVGFTSVYFEMF
jgi:hypothetical protein